MELSEIKQIKDSILRNKELCQRYPFLIPRNVFTDKIIDNYDYSWTLADVPKGWKNLFLQMCEEIREYLIKYNYLNEFRFSQIKEKWGRLEAYNFGAPVEVQEIIDKYSDLTSKTCIICGEPAIVKTKGYVYPLCDKCSNTYLFHTAPIDTNLDDCL